MPKYTFKLSDDGSGVEDDIGVSLPNAEVAYRYACDVVLELMNCRELRTRHWQLDVHDGEGKKVFEIPFVELDPTLTSACGGMGAGGTRFAGHSIVQRRIACRFADQTRGEVAGGALARAAVPGGRSGPQGDPR
jgi:hypothetical protein